MPKSRNSIRLTESQIDALLRRLDDRAAARMSGRKSERHGYRVSAFIEFPKLDNNCMEEVPTRNLSREGIGVLLGRFVYVGTDCNLHLWTRLGHSDVIAGKVVRCAFVTGTPGVYDVGIVFNQPIDIALFHDKAAAIRMLLLDTDEETRAVLKSAFTQLGAEVVCTNDEAATSDAARSKPCELLVLNRDSLGERACKLAGELRAAGYVRAIGCVTDSCSELCSGANGEECCQRVGMNPNALADLLNGVRVTPIISSLTMSPEVAALVNRFVHSLRERVAALEAEYAKHAFAQLAAAAKSLATSATGCGFAPLAGAAGAVAAAAASDTPDPVQLRTSLQHLIQQCTAARPARAPVDAA